VRENSKVLGNLVNAFNFNQKPRPAVILSPNPDHRILHPPAPGNLAGFL
jgi:hypothetical protein